METSLAFWIAAAFASLCVGMSKGGLPIIAQLAVPTMTLFMPGGSPALAAGLILPVYIISDQYGVWLYRREFSARNLKILIPAGMLGTFLGFLTVSSVSSEAVKLTVGLVGFYYLGDKQLRRRRANAKPRPADVPRGVFWGMVAGCTSYLTHAGGPPFQAYTLPQQMPKMTFAGTSTIFFTVINMTKLPPYIVAGQLTWDSVVAILWLSPVAVFGAWAGYRLTKILPEKLFFAFVEIALLFLSFKLVYDGLTGLLG